MMNHKETRDIKDNVGGLPGIPCVNLIDMKIQNEAVNLLPPHVMRSNKVLPISRNNNSITIAMPETLNHQIIDDIRMITGLEVIPVYANMTDIDATLSSVLAFTVDPVMEEIIEKIEENIKIDPPVSVSESPNKTRKTRDEAPVIRMVNLLLRRALEVGSSDIHIEPQDNEVRVRFRLDGELYPVISVSKALLGPLVSSIKIMASIDIAEKRMPQDGRFHMSVDGNEVDLRVATLPTAYGEKVAIRILSESGLLNGIEHLGLSDLNYQLALSLLKKPHGMILVTGSTGSGKTTTLYALLHKLNSTSRNIITLEDPVEYSLRGINQVQINTRAGLSFSSGLGSILRQDPDIIMVGEIRDQATAALSVQAALTGHLVLSTLHTNSAADTIVRLADMGIEPFLLANCLNGVVSQRLARRLCPNCRCQYSLDTETAMKLEIEDQTGQIFYRPKGCNMCRHLGYLGRIALQEILNAGPRVRSVIYNHGTSEEIQTAARQEGMNTLRCDALAKARQGLISLEDVFTV